MYQHQFKLHVSFNDSDENIDNLMSSHAFTKNVDDVHHFVEYAETFDGDEIFSALFVVHSPSFNVANYGDGKTRLRAFVVDEEVFHEISVFFPYLTHDCDFHTIDFNLDFWVFHLYNSEGQLVATNESA